jgi:hypothetical protein
MKNNIVIAFGALLALVGCSRQGLVVDPADQNAKQLPIEFNVQKQNMTKANLEDLKHYNFGVYAWKVGSSSLADAKVMENYLVGHVKGYYKEGATGWFYEGLGTSEYKNTADGYYKYTEEDFVSANENQYIRYWDLAYTNTNFYCYAPYNKAVTFSKDENALNFGPTVIKGGYDRTLCEYMYAGVQAINADKKPVDVPFKHMGAQVQIRFYEAIPGYKVEIIDLSDSYEGIQAAPAIKDGDAYTKGTYYTTQGAKVTFETVDDPKYIPSWEGSTSVNTPLVFQIPGGVIKSKEDDGTQQFSESPTLYYPVSQPKTSTTGLTFHVSYKVIAEDNDEVITVRNASVHVPYKSGDSFITVWQPNVKYIYTFKITKSTNGTTDPGVTVDPTEPTPGTAPSLYPIIFESATIEDYTTVEKTYTVSE